MKTLFFFLCSTLGSTWVVELKPNVNPREYAQKHGVDYDGATEVNENLHIFSSNDQNKRLVTTRDVEWLEEQIPKMQHRRYLVETTLGLSGTQKQTNKISHSFRELGDPLRGDQWHLDLVGLSDTLTYSGEGVVLGIVDDGLQVVHPEIFKNYKSEHSWNYNGGPHGTTDPSPVDPRDGHGTSAAGVAAGVRGNNHCGQGVAPNASLVGLRLISRPVTDLQESQALSRHFASVDIYSNSWGPEDTGFGVDAPGRLVRETLAKYAGSSIGRGGKGTIYVWASGNGRHVGDSCAFDGYAGNPYVNAIGAIDYTEGPAYYSEGCSNLLAVTPSSGEGRTITTADLLGDAGYTDGECTKTFGGTSSAAPLAAGIFALMLEKRPDLGWRDVRHVVVQSLYKDGVPPVHTNARGFGMLHIPSLMQVLENYQKVPRKQKQIFSDTLTFMGPIGNRMEVTINTVGNDLTFIETAVLIVSISHPNRGKVRVSLQSPDQKITSVLIEERVGDNNPDFNEWPVSSLAFWGNATQGSWKVIVESRDGRGMLKELKLGLFGF